MALPENILKDYLNPVFVETGSYKGDGIQSALDAGFKSVISFEASSELWEKCSERFDENFSVACVLANSAHSLRHIIAPIKTPITFWLDAHECGIAYFENGKGGYDEIHTYPGGKVILAELEQIAQHPIKTHTIMIDDWTIFGTREIEEKLWKMGLRTEYIDGTKKNDILIARP
jgi:hypothetical protein